MKLMVKIECFVVQKGTKFTGSSKLRLTSFVHYQLGRPIPLPRVKVNG